MVVSLGTIVCVDVSESCVAFPAAAASSAIGAFDFDVDGAFSAGLSAATFASVVSAAGVELTVDCSEANDVCAATPGVVDGRPLIFWCIVAIALDKRDLLAGAADDVADTFIFGISW